MRWRPNLWYGTEGYPPRVARRLMVLNGTVWCAAGFAAIFALYDMQHEKLRTLGVINGALAAALAGLPLLHRFGELAAGLTYVAVAFTAVYLICAMIGTDSGMQVQFVAVAAGCVLVFGTDRAALLAVVWGLAVVLVMALEFSAPRDTGLFTPRQMIENYVFCVVGTASILFLVVFHAVREMGRAEDRAEREFQRSEQLLANILPAPIAQRLKAGEAFIADAHDDVSVLFADLAGSTALAGSIAPDDFVRFLNELFSAFDALVGRHGLEKIKITGDCYMAVGGAPSPHPDHPAAMARLALAMRDTAETIRDPLGRPAAIRIGLASGPVVTGVIGTGKLFYDVWGDAVNLASRMESTGAPGRIQVSESMRARLPRAFIVQERGMVDVKGKGLVPIWLLTGERPETAS